MREKEGEMQKREREGGKETFKLKGRLTKRKVSAFFSPRIIHWQNVGQNDWEGFSSL